MNKFFKHSAFLFIGLAGLVILAHLFIHHDHHSDFSVFNSEDACHTNTSKLPSGFPEHCQAFNELTYAKIPSDFVIGQEIHSFDLIIPGSLDSIILSSVLSGLKTANYQNPVLIINIRQFSPFRAPPYLV